MAGRRAAFVVIKGRLLEFATLPGVLRLPEKGAFTKVYALKMMQKI